MRLNGYMVAGVALLLYALWSAYAPAPALSSDAGDSVGDTGSDGTTQTDALQAVSNAVGSAALAFGFGNDEPTGDTIDDSTADTSDDTSSADLENLFGGDV